MTPEAFRTTALSFAGAKEQQVLGSRVFRIRNKVFATLGWPEIGMAVVKLKLADQLFYTATVPALSCQPGGRGKRGVTCVRLAGVHARELRPVLETAWRLAGG